MHKQNQKPYDENGERHGEWIEYYNNGQLYYCTNYVHGVEHGLWEMYDLDGKLKMKSSCHMGLKHGVSERYSNGKLNAFFVDHMDTNLLFVSPHYNQLQLSL